MAITNEEVVKYCNEVVRVRAEELRDLKYKIENDLVEWYNTISENVPDDAGELLIDNRQVNGVTQLSGADITNLITRLDAVFACLDGTGNINVIEKPCVRTFNGI